MSAPVLEPFRSVRRLHVQGSVEMNENRRILLLALGIMTILASDPPVGAGFDWSRSACAVVRNLGVSAFDALVRSTLPDPTALPEGERTQEVLVAERPGRRTGGVAASTNRPADESRGPVQSVETTGDLRILSVSPARVRVVCDSSASPVEVLRIEAVMHVRGSATPSPG